MRTEFESATPKLKSVDLDRQVRHERFLFVAGAVESEDIETANKIVDCARKIASGVCTLGDKKGFLLTLTKRDQKFPILTAQIGEVDDPDERYGADGKRGKYTDFANLKAQILKDNPDFDSSSENLALDEDKRVKSRAGQDIPGGAVAFKNNWIIGVSGFKDADLDIATALGIGFGAFKNYDETVEIAHTISLSCIGIYTKNENTFTEPFLSHNPNLETFSLPEIHI